MQGFCPLKIEITQCPNGFRLKNQSWAPGIILIQFITITIIVNNSGNLNFFPMKESIRERIFQVKEEFPVAGNIARLCDRKANYIKHLINTMTGPKGNS